jgi:hypothetical protein
MMAVSSFTLASTMISKSAFPQSPIPSPKTQAILDGEICALDEHGFPTFEWLVNRGRQKREELCVRVARGIASIFAKRLVLRGFEWSVRSWLLKAY